MGTPHQLPSVCPSPAQPSRNVMIASYLLMACTLLLVMWQKLLPGLLCACLGFLLTRALASLLARIDRRPPGPTPDRWAQVTAATLVIFAPLIWIGIALTHSRGYLTDIPHQYKELLDFLAHTVLELQQKLPPELGVLLPQGAAEIQQAIATNLATKAGALAMAGKAWLGGLLHAYVGLLIGTLAAVRPRTLPRAPLTQALQRRVMLLGEAFRQIVAAQFWIALFNTCLTALFLLLILPVFDMALPYTPALIMLTFIAGLIPIVGNLFCNVVLTIVGLSVSPLAAAVCLGFLILIHKAEYVINARVVGQRTHMAVWELLTVMFIAESVFGPAGLVAAPLFYAYLKKELEAARLV
ncbi:AI-2E family transporter [Comamonas sp. NoAH]|uniref:AI-2E family transporter n=1 Tax=Comamonas halotolerans TaxID=3041496 RepID=UPI0024E0F1F2|nr:AI-2E family transporter [Comamonas sp. NoAH]